LEEVAKVRSMVDLYAISTTDHKMEDVAQAFDKRVDDVVNKWRKYLRGEDKSGVQGTPAWFEVKSEDVKIQKLLDVVDCAVRALKAQEVELTPKRKSKRKMVEEDDHSPETKRQFERVDMEVGASRAIHLNQAQGSSQAIPRRTSRRLMEKEGTSRDAEGNQGA
jgi:hypothetical protein